jgi:hypothetical protein
MEHTKKFVLVDPRFVRPTMKDKALSGLDTDISNILNSDASDEIKAKSYMTALARFKILSDPPKPVKPPPAVTQSVPSVTFKAVSPPKRPHKRVKVETVNDPTLWRRTQRTPTKKKFGPQWLSESSSKKKKSLKSWIEQ